MPLPHPPFGTVSCPSLDSIPDTLLQALKLERQVTARVCVRSWQMNREGCSGPAVSHETMEITYVERGSLRFEATQGVFNVGTGRAIVVPAGTEHTTTLAEGTKACAIHLERRMVDQIAEEMRCREGEGPRVVTEAERIGLLSKMLESEASRPSDGSGLIVEALSEALVVEVLRSLPDRRTLRGPRDHRLRKAVAMIENCYKEPLTIEALAHAAKLSRFHFSRLFREQTGMSPYQYLTCHRLERAAELLRRGGRSVTDVAFSVGFQDLGRFSRLFRQRFDCAPREVLARHGGERS